VYKALPNAFIPLWNSVLMHSVSLTWRAQMAKLQNERESCVQGLALRTGGSISQHTTGSEMDFSDCSSDCIQINSIRDLQSV